MLDRKPRSNGESLYYRCLDSKNLLASGIMAKANRRKAIATSTNPDFLKDVIEVEPDNDLKELAKKKLGELGNSLKFIFED